MREKSNAPVLFLTPIEFSELIEEADGVFAEDAVGFAHGLEEQGEFAEELRREEAVGALKKLAEDALGEQADGVGEEAEEDAHEEVRDLGAGGAEIAVLHLEAFGEPGELAGGILGDEGVGALGAEDRCRRRGRGER